MFIKHLKHDLVFGRAMFFTLGICIILAAVAGRIVFHVMEDKYAARSIINVNAILGIGLVMGFVAVHFSQFIEKSMFGDSGYLALTLPITRLRLIFSKLLATWVWFNFVLAAVFVAIIILEGTQLYDPFADVILPRVSADMIAYYLNMFFMFFFCINLLLFGLTLHNSVFGRWKVPGFIAACLSLGTVIGYSYTAIRLLNRSREIVEVQAVAIVGGEAQIITRSAGQKAMGIGVGRLEMFGSYLDIYLAAIGLALGLLAFFGTLYLLKKRVSLQ